MDEIRAQLEAAARARWGPERADAQQQLRDALVEHLARVRAAALTLAEEPDMLRLRGDA